MREFTKSLLNSLLLVAVDCQEQNDSFAVTQCNVDPNTASVSTLQILKFLVSKSFNQW